MTAAPGADDVVVATVPLVVVVVEPVGPVVVVVVDDEVVGRVAVVDVVEGVAGPAGRVTAVEAGAGGRVVVVVDVGEGTKTPGIPPSLAVDAPEGWAPSGG